VKIIVIYLLFIFSSTALATENTNELFNPNQTSASLLLSYSQSLMDDAPAEQRSEAGKKHVLVYDIYIKARSYSILNKSFFWLAVIFGLLVLLWPSISVVFKSRLANWEWLKSATVQTTVTGIAALMFAFYSQYKDKQTYAETLMRYVVYSDETAHDLSKKVAEELAKIDRGFSFNSVIGNKGENN
jgi:hypothetical protein